MSDDDGTEPPSDTIPLGRNWDFEDEAREFGSEAVRVALRGAKKVGELRPLPFLDLAALASKRAPARQWSLDGFMPLNKTTLLTGRGGVGKSLVAQLMCTCNAAGVPFLGTATMRMPAMYVSWEDDADELWRRQEAIAKVLDLPLAVPGLTLLSMADQDNPTLFSIGEGGAGRPTKRGEQFAEEIDINGGLFVLDNASHIYGGNHDALDEVAQFAHWLNRLAQPGPQSVSLDLPRAGLLLHHPNKAGAEWLGSVAYENQFRSRLFMDRPDGPDLDLRRLTNPKANYSKAGGEVVFRWYEGAFIRDDDLPDDMRARLAETAGASADNDAFLACLAERTRQQRAVSEKVSSTFAPKVFAGMPQAKGADAKRLSAAMDRLFMLGKIERALLPWTHNRKPIEGLREAVR